MKIRHAKIDDLGTLLEIYNEVINTSPVTFDLEDQTLEERKVWFNQFNNRYPIIVAEEDGKVIGYACLTKFRPKPAYNHTAENSIYISRQVRGKGIGSNLLRELLKLAKDLDYHTVVAVIANDERASVNLHKKFGFKKTGSLLEAGYKFNHWHDIHFYQLKLDKEKS